MDQRFKKSLLTLPHAGFPKLEAAATAEGHAFLKRMQDDWEAGTNRFSRPGEYVVGISLGDELVAIGGLNKDPYAIEATTGRLRHLYVSTDHRRCGVGRGLVDTLLSQAGSYYHRIRLRTDSAEAAAFYESYGFQPTREPDATHSLRLNT
ncbi:GNAT family N-acetyltransferase [Parvibaculaceae bacterium PLY_AMNH_Bact1]|nr:GNAT family N-acetyltransferase [Parvibaculaceae bacterium PLY_AMNH_Bact1]